ncbi:hypothetical protein B7463_g3528, partial [Scytalidium lignicola]
MNADHQESLSLYLRHFNHLPASSAQNPTLQDLTLSEMTISTGDGKTHTVPFTPPMKSWADARVQTVDMDTAARKALGIAPIDHGPAAIHPPTLTTAHWNRTRLPHGLHRLRDEIIHRARHRGLRSAAAVLPWWSGDDVVDCEDDSVAGYCAAYRGDGVA